MQSIVRPAVALSYRKPPAAQRVERIPRHAPFRIVEIKVIQSFLVPRQTVFVPRRIFRPDGEPADGRYGTPRAFCFLYSSIKATTSMFLWISVIRYNRSLAIASASVSCFITLRLPHSPLQSHSPSENFLKTNGSFPLRL